MWVLSMTRSQPVSPPTARLRELPPISVDNFVGKIEMSGQRAHKTRHTVPC
jgi:hypothetical protein